MVSQILRCNEICIKGFNARMARFSADDRSIFSSYRSFEVASETSPRDFDFSEFPFIARNIENLVFQSAERGFRGRCTRLVAKCKPEKQRASELAKWVRDCLHLLSRPSRSSNLTLSPHLTPHSLERASFVLLSSRSPWHLLHSLFATDLKEGLCRSLSYLEIYLNLDHTIGMVHWVTRFRYPHRGSLPA